MFLHVPACNLRSPELDILLCFNRDMKLTTQTGTSSKSSNNPGGGKGGNTSSCAQDPPNVNTFSSPSVAPSEESKVFVETAAQAPAPPIFKAKTRSAVSALLGAHDLASARSTFSSSIRTRDAVAAANKLSSGISTAPPGSSMPGSSTRAKIGAVHGVAAVAAATSDGVYDRHWERLKNLTASECEASEIAFAYGCEAIRHHRGSRGWAAILGGGTLGMYDTKEEAIKRAACAAMVMAEIEPGPKKAINPLARAKAAKSGHSSSKSWSGLSHSNRGNNSPKDSEPGSSSGSSWGHSRKPSFGADSQPRSQKSSFPKTRPTTPPKSPPTWVTADSSIETTRAMFHGSGRYGRPKACEMSDPQTREVIANFRSCSQAERVTKISRASIGKVCRDGGGVVDGKFFRFVYLNPKGNMSKRGLSANKKRKLMEVQPAAVDSVEAATEDLGTDEDASEDGTAMADAQRRKTSSPTRRNVQKDFVGRPFDVSTLLPLSSGFSKSRKLIELVDGATGNVLVCFRGAADCAQALNLDRKKVVKACQQEGTSEEVSFPSFRLRYAAMNEPSCAYEYGTHEQDFYDTREGHKERLARWKTMFHIDKIQRKGNEVIRGSSPNETNDFAGRNGGSGDDGELVRPKGASSTEVAVASLRPPITTVMEPDTLLSLRKPSFHSLDMLCILCQQNKAQIVFEPCHHCVLCSKCDESGHCQKFCPKCRIPIMSKTQPSFVRVVRPRIYSAYSFM